MVFLGQKDGSFQKRAGVIVECPLPFATDRTASRLHIDLRSFCWFLFFLRLDPKWGGMECPSINSFECECETCESFWFAGSNQMRERERSPDFNIKAKERTALSLSLVLFLFQLSSHTSFWETKKKSKTNSNFKKRNERFDSFWDLSIIF